MSSQTPQAAAHPWLKDVGRYRITNAESHGADITAGLNGVQFRWPDGYEGDVPHAVAEILNNAYYMVFPKHATYNRDTEKPPDKVKQLRFIVTPLEFFASKKPETLAKESLVEKIAPKIKAKNKSIQEKIKEIED